MGRLHQHIQHLVPIKQIYFSHSISNYQVMWWQRSLGKIKVIPINRIGPNIYLWKFEVFQNVCYYFYYYPLSLLYTLFMFHRQPQLLRMVQALILLNLALTYYHNSYYKTYPSSSDPGYEICLLSMIKSYRGISITFMISLSFILGSLAQAPLSTFNKIHSFIHTTLNFPSKVNSFITMAKEFEQVFISF